MALWQDPYQHMDPLTFDTVLQLQLEDTEELASTSKGKGREGTISDAQLALQMYSDDLKACSSTIADMKMARSVAIAIVRDAQFIRQEQVIAQQVAQDRDLAAALQADNGHGRQSAPATQKTKDDADIWDDPEMLSKAAAIYMPEAEDSSPPPLFFDLDSDAEFDPPVAESSAWAATRKTKDKPKLGHCVACGDEKDFFEVARVPCKNNHEYCRDCLAELFRLSMTDESLFPPRCCSVPVPLQHVRFFLPSALAKEFEFKFDELSTKNRTYCHDRSCAAFIPTDAVVNDIATCPRCRRTTCIICKEPSHSGDCPEDTALQQLVNTAEASQWQRCYQCNRFVELNYGCNHMTCPCGAHFCYVCGMRWHTCGCAQWDEQRLEARAAQIVDRNPRRRLFQPPRAAHQQPVPTTDLNATATSHQGGAATSASSVWQSDWSDHSEWEADWDLDDDPTPEPSIPTPRLQSPQPHIPTVPEKGDRAREQRIAEAMQHLRENHECDHDKWRWIRGPHTCEECRHRLREYIFECKQCRLQACNRCRRNRL